MSAQRSKGVAVAAAVVAGLLAGFGIAVPVGAIGTYLVALSARTSLRVGAAAALGVATTDGGYALVAVLGGQALEPHLAPVAGPLKVASVVVLVGLAVRTAWTALRPGRQGVAAGAPRPLRAYLSLLALTAVNPATVVYFTALVVGSRAELLSGPAERAAFVGAAFAASAAWQLLLAGGGTLVGHALTGPRGRRATALVSSAVVLVLAARLATS